LQPIGLSSLTMAELLASAMEQLRLTAQDMNPDLIQSRLETPLAEEDKNTQASTRPRKQAAKSGSELLAELEAEFLTPSPKFSSNWLNQLQKYRPSCSCPHH
jgi:antiviral helicase SKI2